jgi:hypothetical protein
MIEDKLTHDERLRLECIALAIRRLRDDNGDVVTLAKDYEKYVREHAEVPHMNKQESISFMNRGG